MSVAESAIATDGADAERVSSGGLPNALSGSYSSSSSGSACSGAREKSAAGSYSCFCASRKAISASMSAIGRCDSGKAMLRGGRGRGVVAARCAKLTYSCAVVCAHEHRGHDRGNARCDRLTSLSAQLNVRAGRASWAFVQSTVRPGDGCESDVPRRTKAPLSPSSSLGAVAGASARRCQTRPMPPRNTPAFTWDCSSTLHEALNSCPATTRDCPPRIYSHTDALVHRRRGGIRKPRQRTTTLEQLHQSPQP